MSKEKKSPPSPSHSPDHNSHAHFFSTGDTGSSQVNKTGQKTTKTRTPHNRQLAPLSVKEIECSFLLCFLIDLPAPFAFCVYVCVCLSRSLVCRWFPPPPCHPSILSIGSLHSHVLQSGAITWLHAKRAWQGWPFQRPWSLFWSPHPRLFGCSLPH